MKRVEKSGAGAVEKQEILWEKLRRVGKRGGHTTPVASFWRTNELAFLADPPTVGEQIQKDSTNFVVEVPFKSPIVSSRKLAATLWEIHSCKLPPHNMQNGVTAPPPRLRRTDNHHRRRHRQPYKDNGGVLPLDPSPGSPDLPGGSSSSSRRVVVPSLLQHHQSIENSTHAIGTVSAASYESSMEVAPYNAAVTPSSSIELKGIRGEPSFSLRTSTELLKVLNRLWSLEEQHIYNMSLVKKLKKELDHARSQIKDLVREKQADRHEMDKLMKHVTEDKLVRKNKEQDRINATIHSMRDELKNERKLRKHSESLHRKLARELCEVKTSLISISKELVKERNSRDLVEDLCDHFAQGIRDYEKEVHALRQKSDKDWGERTDHNQLILHISESWLDERMQVKLHPGRGVGEKKSTVEKLSPEVDSFLQTKRNGKAKINGNHVLRDPTFRRSSLESVPLNAVASAPRYEDDEDDTTNSDSNCFELQKTSESNLQYQENKCQNEETVKQKQVKKKLESSDRTRASSPSSLQVKFEDDMAHGMLHGQSRNGVEVAELITTCKGNPVETSISQKPGKCEAAEENISEQKCESEGVTGLNSNYAIDHLIRNHHSMTVCRNMQPDNDYGVTSCIWRGLPSPVRQWTDKLPSEDLDVSETSPKLPPDLKENTLKAKLFEARTRGQRSRLHQKTSSTPF